MTTARCPSCHSDCIIDDDACEGDLVECLNCRRELEIIGLRPPQVALLETSADDAEPESGNPGDWTDEGDEEEEED